MIEKPSNLMEYISFLTFSVTLTLFRSFVYIFAPSHFHPPLYKLLFTAHAPAETLSSWRNRRDLEGTYPGSALTGSLNISTLLPLRWVCPPPPQQAPTLQTHTSCTHRGGAQHINIKYTVHPVLSQCLSIHLFQSHDPFLTK